MRRNGKFLSRVLSIVMAVVLVLGALPVSAASAENFTDIDGHWGEEAIIAAVEAGLFIGIDEAGTIFDPDGGMERSMFVTVLQRVATMLNGPEPTGEPQEFIDVPADAWFAGAVDWAVRTGVTKGVGDGEFWPAELVTREQMCVFIVRFLEYLGFDLTAYREAEVENFADHDKMSDWAVEAIYIAKALGLVQGKGENEFDPSATATRAEAATIFMNFMGKVEELLAAQPDEGEGDGEDEGGSTGGGSTGGSTGGGTGGGGGYYPSTSSFDKVYIALNDVEVEGVTAGDVVSAYVAPTDATYTLSWMADGVEVSTAATYKTSFVDVGKDITVEVTGTGDYDGYTTTSAAIYVLAADTGIYNVNEDAAPIVLTDLDSTTFVDEDNNPVDVDLGNLNENQTLTFTVEDAGDTTSDEVTEAKTAIEVAFKDSNATAPEDTTYAAIEAEMTLTTTATDEDTGETVVTDETSIHPIGEVVINVAKADLGIAEDVDISKYTFVAAHTNKANEAQNVKGEVVTLGGEQYVRFVLNGLSRIIIGNIPPRTVTFDTDGGSAVEPQVVKFGGYAEVPESPTKEGYLFTGWDHDLTYENIIADITVTARWVEGTFVSTSQITGAWYEGTAPAATAPANITVDMTTTAGTVLVEFADAESYTASLSYGLTITAPTGATGYATATTAEGAIAGAGDAKTGTTVNVTEAVTDSTGAALESSTITYIAWVDADGVVVELQSIRITVGDALSKYDVDAYIVEDVAVDRGYGLPTFYLTGGSHTTASGTTVELPDFVGAAQVYTSGGSDGVGLSYYHSFSTNFYYSDADNGSFSYDADNYTGVKGVIEPFEGTTFTTLPTVVFEMYDYDAGWTEQSITPTLENGNIVITFDIPTNADSEFCYVYVDGTQYELWIPTDDTTTERTSISCATWAEVVAAVNSGEYNSIYYTGTESVTLTETLSLAASQRLWFEVEGVGITIDNGGTLILNGDENGAEYFGLYGDVTVKSGGVITTNSRNHAGTVYSAGLYVGNAGAMTVENGGKIVIPASGHMYLSISGGVTVEQGGEITIGENGYLYQGSGDTTIAGTVTFAGGAMAYFDVGTTLTSTGVVSTVDGGYFEMRGGLTSEAGSQLTINGDAQYAWRNSTISGKSELNGAITVNTGTLELRNTGYSVVNTGTIDVASGATLDILGTVLVNTGSITGAGTIDAGVYESLSEYDDGREWVTATDTSNSSADDYGRYVFEREPATTVDVLCFPGELDNGSTGTSTITPVTE